MEQFYPSEIARLVLGYLKEVGCLKSWKTFLQESSDLHEYCRLYNEGKRNYPIKVYGKSLLDILEEYCILKNSRDCSNGNISQDSNISKVGAVCSNSKNLSVLQGLSPTDDETKKDSLFYKSSNDTVAKSMFDEHNTADVTDFNQHTKDISGISEVISTQVDLNSNGINPIHMESNYNCKISSNMQETVTFKNSQSVKKTAVNNTISVSNNADYNGSRSSFVPKKNVNPSECNSDAVIDSVAFVNSINSDVDNVEVASEVITAKNDHDIDNAERVTVDKHSSDISVTKFSSIVPNLVSNVIEGNNIQTSSNQSKHMLSATQLSIQPAPVFDVPFSTVPTLVPRYDQNNYHAQNVQYLIILNPTVGCYGASNSEIYVPTIPTIENVIVNPMVLTPPKAVVMPNVENLNIDVHAPSENVENFQSVPITRKGKRKIKNIIEDSYKREKNKDEKSSKTSTVCKKKRQPRRKLLKLFKSPSKATRRIISDENLDKIPVISVPEPSPSNSDQQSLSFSKDVYVSDESDTMLVENANRETVCNKNLIVLVTPLKKKVLEHFKIFSEASVKTTDMLNCQNDTENISEHQSSRNSIATHIKSESSPEMDLKKRKTTEETLKIVSVNTQDSSLSESKIFAHDHEFSQKDVTIVIEKYNSLKKNSQEYFPTANTESCSHNIKSIRKSPRNSSVTNDGGEQLTLSGDGIKKISKLFFADTSSTLVDCSDLKIMTPQKKDGFYNNDRFNINSPIIKEKRKISKLYSSPKQTPGKMRKLHTSLEKVKHNDPKKQLPNPSDLTFHPITADKSFLKNSSVLKVQKNSAASISVQPLNVSSNKLQKQPFITCNLNSNVLHKEKHYKPPNQKNALNISFESSHANLQSLQGVHTKFTGGESSIQTSYVNSKYQKSLMESVSDSRKFISKSGKMVQNLDILVQSANMNCDEVQELLTFQQKSTQLPANTKTLQKSLVKTDSENILVLSLDSNLPEEMSAESSSNKELQESPEKSVCNSRKVTQKSAFCKEIKQYPNIHAGIEISPKCNISKINCYSDEVGQSSSDGRKKNNNQTTNKKRGSRPTIKIAAFKSPDKKSNGRSQNSPKKSYLGKFKKKSVADEKVLCDEKSDNNKQKNPSSPNITDKSEKCRKTTLCNKSSKYGLGEEKWLTTQSIVPNFTSIKFPKDETMKTYGSPEKKLIVHLEQPDNFITGKNIQDIVESDIGRSSEEGSELDNNAIAFLTCSQVDPCHEPSKHTVAENEINILKGAIGELQTAEESPAKEVQSNLKLTLLLRKINAMGLDNVLDKLMDQK